jgi:hypothetical protein
LSVRQTTITGIAQSKTYTVSVSVHSSLPELTEMEVKEILDKASTMLKKDSTHTDDDDVSCDVTFTLKGPVGTFGNTSAKVDGSNIDAVHNVDSSAATDFHVKVVDKIS